MKAKQREDASSEKELKTAFTANICNNYHFVLLGVRPVSSPGCRETSHCNWNIFRRQRAVCFFCPSENSAPGIYNICDGRGALSDAVQCPRPCHEPGHRTVPGQRVPTHFDTRLTSAVRKIKFK